MRAGRDFRREAFTPEELAGLTDKLHRARMIEGLFLSSGIVGHGEYAMDRIIATGDILRRAHSFKGYLHLKIMPGASDSAIEAALQLANRVSVNLEAPNALRLSQLAPSKDLENGLLGPLRRVKSLLTHIDHPVSRTTQFVVGAAGESDLELLTTSQLLYRELGLSRVYYSRFNPAPDTPLENEPPETLEREHRLYQADMLIRDYGFNVGDLLLNQDGRLPLDIDPKLAWAREHVDRFPVEVNTASRSALLHVPGIGPRSADRIVSARAGGRIRHTSQLRRIGVRTGAALGWLTIDGKHTPRQLPLPLRNQLQ
jgi:predicted DNA-binding helix-hairpin-helix protein